MSFAPVAGIVALSALVGLFPEIIYQIRRLRGRVLTAAQQFELEWPERIAEERRAAEQRRIWRRNRNQGIYWKPGMGVYSMSAAGAA